MPKKQIHKLKGPQKGFYIKQKRISPIGMAFLLMLFMLFLFLPFGLLGVMTVTRQGLHFKFLVGVLFHWGIAYYLFRLISWNKYGREIYFQEENKIKSYSDYKFFKDNYQEMNIVGCKFTMEQIGYVEDGWAMLKIKNQSTFIKSSIKVQKQELQHFLAVFKD